MRAVLFDLDGTLLDIDLGRFLGRYFTALSKTFAEILSPDQVEPAMAALNSGTEAMMRPHPGLTNYEAFWQEVATHVGLDPEAHAAPLEQFYEEVFPSLSDGYGPATGSAEALAAARECGLKIAIATNPIFPRRAVEHRMSWAGIDHTAVDAITSYETMHSCKPHASYFKETAEMIGVSPIDCMMVGDDPVLDMAATDVGMQTFYVGDGTPAHYSYKGSLTEVANLLPRLCID